jgi:AcrR family transcriptional regulator
MAVTRTPRTKWIEEGLRALSAGGPDAVRIEALARTLGVTKGGFYWSFEGRRALLEAMLEAWEAMAIDQVIEFVESEGGDARAKLRRLYSLAAGAAELLDVELAIREWARRDAGVRRRLQRIDNRRMDYMRALFGELCRDEEEVQGRCMLAFSLFIGSNLVAADYPERNRSEVIDLAFEQLLE